MFELLIMGGSRWVIWNTPCTCMPLEVCRELQEFSIAPGEPHEGEPHQATRRGSLPGPLCPDIPRLRPVGSCLPPN